MQWPGGFAMSLKTRNLYKKYFSITMVLYLSFIHLDLR